MTQADITIDTLGIKGDGIGCLPDGRRVFVAGVLPGERVRVALGQDRREGVSAKLVSVLEKSACRTEPPCVHFMRCGGCALQHIDRENYVRFKKDRVMAALNRVGLAPEIIEDACISLPGSRRRAIFAARCLEDGKVQIGFNERASHRLAEVENCAVLKPALVRLLPLLRHYMPQVMRESESYDIALTESGGLVDILIAVLGKVGRGCDKNMKVVLEEMAQDPGITRLSWQESALKKPQTIVQKRRFTIKFGKSGGSEVELPPGAFLQATEEGEAALTGFAVSALNRKGHVADLYAGCGTFSFSLLERGHRVDAFEGNRAALQALARAGEGSGKLRAELRDLAKEPLTFQELKAYDAVVIDPPRIGALKQVEEIASSAVKRVVSISCNPDSFARDGQALVQAGFMLKRFRIVDQFLWSPHIEVAGFFTRL